MRNPIQETDPPARGWVTSALAVIDHGTTSAERAAAASVLRSVTTSLLRGRFDERLTTDVLNSLALRLDDPDVVRELLHAVVKGCWECSKIGFAIERLAGRAFERNLAGSLWHLVRIMLQTIPWQAHVRDRWAARAFDFASTSQQQPEVLIRPWLDLHGAVPSWMAAGVGMKPDLLVSPYVVSRWVWPLHMAAPTTRGWLLLAGDAHHKDHTLDAAAFGLQLDVALETLDQALGEERDAAIRLVLARWLVDLGGQP